MKTIDNDSFLKCNDSFERLFINCEYSATLWTEVEKWINSIGFLNYKIDNEIKILGNRKKALNCQFCIVIYQAVFIRQQGVKTGTAIQHVKKILKRFMVTEKYWENINYSYEMAPSNCRIGEAEITFFFHHLKTLKI